MERDLTSNRWIIGVTGVLVIGLILIILIFFDLFAG